MLAPETGILSNAASRGARGVGIGIYLALSGLAVPVLGCASAPPPPGHRGGMEIERAIRRGVGFLLGSQRPDGSFPSRLCRRPDLTDCRDERAVFPTTFAVEALDGAERAMPGLAPHPEAGRRRALEFLRPNQEPDSGLWRYWTRDDPLWGEIGPDLDDTACASVLLDRHAVRFRGDLSTLLEHRDAAGLFQTWTSY